MTRGSEAVRTQLTFLCHSLRHSLQLPARLESAENEPQRQRMEADGDPYVPHSMVLMGGPIDTRVNPTAVNTLAERRGVEWFRRNVITKVPFPNPGFMRDVYPGFLQLHGFVSMNLDRHLEAHRRLFQHLIEGAGAGDDQGGSKKHMKHHGRVRISVGRQPGAGRRGE